MRVAVVPGQNGLRSQQTRPFQNFFLGRIHIELSNPDAHLMYLQRKNKYEIKINTEPPPKDFNRPIITDMARNTHGAFSGLGRHCINDLLYQAGIFPGTPSYVICLDLSLYCRLKDLIYSYIARFSSQKFLKKIVSVQNTNNPFAFNETSNQNYISSYIDVFRRTKVCFFDLILLLKTNELIGSCPQKII